MSLSDNILDQVEKIITNNSNELIIRNDDLVDFPIEIFEIEEEDFYSNLIKLTVGGEYNATKIQRIPPAIVLFENLEVLDLSYNNLDDLPIRVKKLKKINNIDLSNNNIVTFPKNLLNITGLKYLRLSHNKIELLHEDIEQLNYLESLLVDNNLLSYLPIGIQKMKALCKIDLSYNRFQQIPDHIIYLEKLDTLDLSFNELKDISEKLKELPELKYLYLDGNKIERITSNLKELDNLEELHIINNPIKYEIEYSIKKDWSGKVDMNSLKEYFAKLEEYKYSFSEKNSKRIFRIVVLGNEGVGKSTIINELIKKIGDSQITEKIEETNCLLKIEDKFVNCMFQDFDKTDIKSGVYRLFIMPNTLYLLIWDVSSRKDAEEYSIQSENFSFDYWLEDIRYIEENSSPIILVKSKADLDKYYVKDLKYREIDNLTKLIGRYNITSSKSISTTEKKGMTDLYEDIIMELRNIILKEKKIPEFWLKIEKILDREKSEKYISYDKFKALCKAQSSNFKEGDIDNILKFFRKKGYLLDVKYIGGSINIILDVNWCIKCIKKVFAINDIKKNGYFKLRDIEDLLKSNSDAVLIIQTMMKFGLCFKKDSDTYIIPSLLTSKEPEVLTSLKKEKGRPLFFVYKYEFLHNDIISEIISELMSLSKDEIFWKNGIVLTKEDNSIAIIYRDKNYKYINVSVYGIGKEYLLKDIMKRIDKIHRKYHLINNNVKKYIRCTCEECIHTNNNEPYLFDYEKLIDWYNDRKEYARCSKSNERFSIKYLLLGKLIEEIDLIKEEIRFLLKKASIQDALDKTKEHKLIETNLITNFEFRYNNLKKSRIRNTMSYQDYDILINNLVDDINESLT